MRTFKGGVHPADEKHLTENSAFEIFPSPSEIILPLNQHIGAKSNAIVKKGDIVKRGQLVAEPGGFVSAPIHSSINGVVASVGKEPTASGFPSEAIIIKANQENEELYMTPLNINSLSSEEIIERVKNAGIVGQGGAAFPTSIKLTPPKDKKIDIIILNGCECEPYLTRDYRLILEKTESVVKGLNLIMKALKVEKGLIGIEDNKPEAVKKLKEVLKDNSEISLVELKTKYPQGAEKMLIKAAVNKEVPPGKLPLDIGVVIQNIGTAIAVYDAIVKGAPNIFANLSVSGRGVKNPKNLIVPVGTPIKDVIEFCGGVSDEAVKVIVGGPMMGIAQYDLTAPVMKATSGILVLTKGEIKETSSTNCVRCGKCVEVCALNLIPTKLARLSQLNRFEEAEDYGVTVCMECGTCAYSCPANIPLVQWIRYGKQQAIQLKNKNKS